MLAVLCTRAPLLRYWAIFFLQGDPESKRTVTDGQLRCGGKPQAFELAQKFTPRLGAFPVQTLRFKISDSRARSRNVIIKHVSHGRLFMFQSGKLCLIPLAKSPLAPEENNGNR